MHHIVSDKRLFRQIMDEVFAHVRQPSPDSPASDALLEVVQAEVADLACRHPSEAMKLKSPELLVALKAQLAHLGSSDAQSDQDAAELAALLYLGYELILEIIEALPHDHDD